MMRILTLAISCLSLSSINVGVAQISSPNSQQKQSSSVLAKDDSRIDFGKLEKKLMVLFPNSKVHLISLAHKVLVQGQIHNVQEVDQILSIIRGAVINKSIECRQPIPKHGESTVFEPSIDNRRRLGRNEHLEQAADHLEAAGLKNEAQRIRAQAKLLRHQEKLRQKMKELQKLQEEIRQLGRMAEIHQQVQVGLNIIEVDLEKLHAKGIKICELNNEQPRKDFVNSAGAKTEKITVIQAAGIRNPSAAGDDHTSAVRILNNQGKLTEAGQLLRKGGILKNLAEPSLITTPGRPATMLSGGEFPVLVQQESGENAIEYREFGLRVETVTHVLPDGKIRLELSPKLSERDFRNAVRVNGLVTPGLTVRQINTQVLTESGQTTIIGSLLSQQSQKGSADVHTSQPKGLIIAVTPVLLESAPPENPSKSPVPDSADHSSIPKRLPGGVDKRAIRPADVQSSVKAQQSDTKTRRFVTIYNVRKADEFVDLIESQHSNVFVNVQDSGVLVRATEDEHRAIDELIRKPKVEASRK